MEPNKLENQIREKLNSREIQPSSQAWNRLDNMLSTSENKKKKRSYKWMYVAASIIGLVFISSLFWSEEKIKIDTNSNNQTIVNTNNDNINLNLKNDSTTVIQELKSSIKKQTEITKTENQTLIADSQKKNKTTNSKFSTKNQQLSTKQKDETEKVLVDTYPEKSEKTINENQNVLVSTNNDQSIAENINSVNETHKKETLKIDPKALLSEVDGEIRLSFRKKVMKEVVTKFPLVKEVLVNRNQQ